MSIRLPWNRKAKPNRHTRAMLRALDGVTSDWPAVKQALEDGADASAKDSLVLRRAMEHRCLDVIAMAMAGGADPLAKDGEAIKFILINREKEVFDSLVEADPDLPKRIPDNLVSECSVKSWRQVHDMETEYYRQNGRRREIFDVLKAAREFGNSPAPKP